MKSAGLLLAGLVLPLACAFGAPVAYIGSQAVDASELEARGASRIDQELARGESIGVTRTAKELREFLLGVAQGLERFYAGAEHTGAEVFDVSAG